LLAAACGSQDLPAQSQLVFVSGAVSFPPACTAGQTDPVLVGPVFEGGHLETVSLFEGSAVEPMIAADPLDALHLCGVWQQGRYSNHGSAALLTACTFDGGRTWTHSSVPYSSCTGGTLQRASDPWITFAPDGTVHQIGLTFNSTDATTKIMASRSTDRGHTWSAPIALQSDTSSDFAMDKETITADPNDPNLVYAVWDRLDYRLDVGPTWFARSKDGGITWEPARTIYTPGTDRQSVGNQIVVLPGGRLVNVFAESSMSEVSTLAMQAMVSDDRGVTWSTPIAMGASVPKLLLVSRFQEPVRSGDVLPTVAVDASTGQLYAAWEDAIPSRLVPAGSLEGIYLTRSDDGGATWSKAVVVNGDPNVPAFTPALSAANGQVAVSYYDLRDDIGELFRIRVASWLATSTDSGATFADARLSQPFALDSSPVVGGFFLGDYMGLTHVGSAFLPFFVVTAGDHSDVVFRPAVGPPALKSAPVASTGLSSWLGAARERLRVGTR
jgi:hypothetical protein